MLSFRHNFHQFSLINSLLEPPFGPSILPTKREKLQVAYVTKYLHATWEMNDVPHNKSLRAYPLLTYISQACGFVLLKLICSFLPAFFYPSVHVCRDETSSPTISGLIITPLHLWCVLVF